MVISLLFIKVQIVLSFTRSPNKKHDYDFWDIDIFPLLICELLKYLFIF